MSTKLKQTPSQTLGPYFAYGLTPEQYNYSFTSIHNHYAAEDHAIEGQRIQIRGQIFDGKGLTIDDAIIEIRHTDAEGNYPGIFSRMGTGTEDENQFVFNTIFPGSIGKQAPHINVTIMMRGLLSHCFTRIYFPDEKANDSDPIFNAIPAERRASVIAKRKVVNNHIIYTFNIHMQGPNETAFLDA